MTPPASRAARSKLIGWAALPGLLIAAWSGAQAQSAATSPAMGMHGGLDDAGDGDSDPPLLPPNPEATAPDEPSAEDAEEAPDADAGAADWSGGLNPASIPIPSGPHMNGAPPQQVQPLAAALPAGSGVLDSATIQRIVDRLVALHFLSGVADAQNPEAVAQAIKDFQTSAGISPTGTLDRDTVGRLTTP